MLVVPINEAEAIIEPFWDGGSSEHPTDKMAVLSEYTTRIARQARGSIQQSWCAAEVIIDKAPSGKTVATLDRPCDISLAGYDTLRVFASVPSWVRMSVRGTIDGRVRMILDDVPGGNTHDEFDGEISGSHLTGLRIEFALVEDRPTYIELLWLGLANKVAQQLMEARASPYNAQWRGLLAAKTANPVPEIGIFFGQKELAELRRKVQHGPLKAIVDQLRQQAQRDLKCSPETDIGRYVPNPDRRWCRNRDMRRARTAGVMERLAFVGLIEGNVEMSRMAARMALSAAHCEYWCESIMGIFPGATWHHRSFTEEIYCRACAMVLDWAGYCLTAHGKQVIRDAIIMKGLPRIESDFKRMEYIRHMNQGIVFSSGRIIGMLGLLPAYPRYRRLIEEAENDLNEMIDSYVQSDGGTLEGMAYWNYTFGTAMPLFYALARFHNCVDLREFREAGGLPESLVKTGDYALGMLSTTGDGTTYLPVNDAHADERINPALIAAYCQISDRPEWRNLYAATMQAGASGEDMVHIIFAPSQLGKAEPVVGPRFSVLPNVGEVSSVRAHKGLGYTHFHLSCGPILMTHYHQDRGSFVIESAGETLAIDRGVTTYDHPEVGLIGAAHRHNLLYPESADGRLISQPANAQGGAVTSAVCNGETVMLACDNTLAWQGGIFKASMRRVFSPVPELYMIDDEARMVTPMRVSFRINTRFPIELRGGEYWVHGTRAMLRVVPLNWVPGEVTSNVEGIDSHLQPVNLLRLATTADATHRLLTAIEVVPSGTQPGELWQFAPGRVVMASHAQHQIRIALARKPSLLITITSAGSKVLDAACQDGVWESDG